MLEPVQLTEELARISALTAKSETETKSAARSGGNRRLADTESDIGLIRPVRNEMRKVRGPSSPRIDARAVAVSSQSAFARRASAVEKFVEGGQNTANLASELLEERGGGGQICRLTQFLQSSGQSDGFIGGEIAQRALGLMGNPTHRLGISCGNRRAQTAFPGNRVLDQQLPQQ